MVAEFYNRYLNISKVIYLMILFALSCKTKYEKVSPIIYSNYITFAKNYKYVNSLKPLILRNVVVGTS